MRGKNKVFSPLSAIHSNVIGCHRSDLGKGECHPLAIQPAKPDYSFPGPTYTDFRLDGPEQYEASHITGSSIGGLVGFKDFPGNPLGHRLKASFKDYVRFMPDGEDNIFATLGLIE